MNTAFPLSFSISGAILVLSIFWNGDLIHMRKILCLVLLLLCLFPAFAENLAPGTEPDYIHLYDLGHPLRELCEAIGAEVERISYDKRNEPHFSDRVLERLLAYQMENGLEPSGVFDPDTLRRLLEIDKPACGDLLVWIPMHGGSKYHLSPECSNMDEPRQMPVDCALCFDYSSCKKCNTDSNLRPYGWQP